MNFETIAAYLAGECNAAEKQEIENWRQVNPRNEQDFQQWKYLWEASQTEAQHFKPDAAKAWQKVNPATRPATIFSGFEHKPEAKQHNLFIWIRNVAALLLLATGMSWGIWKVTQKDTNWIEKTSLEADKQQILLADGTRIWLNAQSKVRYPESFDSDTRDVFLEGEAYFEVVHNPEKPFVIHSQGSVTQVLGTSFTVRSYVQEPIIEVNLLSGKVSFGSENKQAHQRVMLQPGQKAVLNKTAQSISILNYYNQNFLAWKTGKLVFEDAALNEALQAPEKYYQVEFTVSDSLLLNCRFTGTFNKAPISHVLEVFAFGSDISYRKQGNTYILLGKGCQ